MKKKAIVLLSGGLDSTVALWWAKEQGWQCHALTFKYGQRHKREHAHALRVARRARVPIQTIAFRLPWGGSSLTRRSARLPRHRSLPAMASHIPSTYVPGRNTLFLSFALSWADQQKAEIIVIGANAIDYSGYPDCRPKFIRAFERVANEGTKMGSSTKKKIAIRAPLLKLSKAGIVKLGQRLKAPLHLTWSCYAGGRCPCGSCDSCLLRAKGFQQAGVRDDVGLR